MDQLDGWPVSSMLKCNWTKLISRYFRDELLFFMHIPKTAGTSFRCGAENYFGKKSVVYDYGAESLVTSELVSKYYYADSPDPWSFLSVCREQGIRMVGGHVEIDRFVTLSGIGRTVTFIRDPLQRVASEFAHIVRHRGYSGSFRDFYTQSFMQNTMSRYFGNIDVEAVGFVGLSEQYEECLNAINRLYGLCIPSLEVNTWRTLQADLHEINSEDEEELKRINQKDIALHHYCSELLDIRLRMMREGVPYAHAHMDISQGQAVSGWAWWGGGNDAPVEVDVLVNGDKRANVSAADLRQRLSFLQPPRRGHVGFHLPVKLKDGDEVQCRVATTGQHFPPTPLIVKIN